MKGQKRDSWGLVRDFCLLFSHRRGLVNSQCCTLCASNRDKTGKYRLVSLASVVLRDRIFSNLERYVLITDGQHGFMQDGLYLTNYYIEMVIDEGRVVVVVLVYHLTRSLMVISLED